MCNPLTHLFKCLLKGLLRYLSAFLTAGDWNNQYHGLLLSPNVPQTATDGIFLFAPPRSTQWFEVWTQTWVGAVGGHVPMMFFLGLFIAVGGRKIRAFTDIFGFTQTNSGSQQQQVSMKLAFMGTLLAYPIAIGALALVHGVTSILVPEGGIDHMFAGLYSPQTYQVASYMGGSVGGAAYRLFVALRLIVFAFVAMVATLVWLLILKTREILVFAYVFMMPVLIPLRYTGIPVASDIAQDLLRKYASVLLIPVAPAFMARLWTTMYPQGEYSGVLVPIIFMLVTLYLTWKLFSSAAPVASSVVQTGVGVGLAGGVLAAGGSPYAAANMVRGRYSKGAMYAAAGRSRRPSREDVEHE